MPHADLDTLQQVRLVLAQAMAKGEDPAEALDRARLLDHPALTAARMRTTFAKTATALDELQVSQLAQVVQTRMPMTALDTKRVIVAWLEHIAEGIT